MLTQKKHVDTSHVFFGKRKTKQKNDTEKQSETAKPPRPTGCIQPAGLTGHITKLQPLSEKQVAVAVSVTLIWGIFDGEGFLFQESFFFNFLTKLRKSVIMPDFFQERFF